MSNPAFRFDHVHIISENPKASAAWYIEMFGATIAADTIARGAPQIFTELGGTKIVIRGRRPGENPAPNQPIQPYSGFLQPQHLGDRSFRFPVPGRPDRPLRRSAQERREVSGRTEARRRRQPAVLRCRAGRCEHRTHAMLKPHQPRPI